MKRSKHVALWLTGSLALAGCHQRPDGTWGLGPSTSGTNTQQNGYTGYSHGGGGGGWHWSGFGGDEGVSRGGFGGHGGEGGFGGE
jgi:hypothetical protein